MKKHILGLLFAVFVVAAMGYNGNLGKIREGDIINNELEIHYNARNDGVKDIDNVKMTVWIPELDYYFRTSPFDISDGNIHSGFMTVPLDDIPAGDYFARVMFSSDYIRDAKWMWISLV